MVIGWRCQSRLLVEGWCAVSPGASLRYDVRSKGPADWSTRTQCRQSDAELSLIDRSALPTSVKNKPWLAAKVVIYGVTGFGLPFYAAHWHL
jgi:hypothetical protein